jgi:hypothetical protein
MGRQNMLPLEQAPNLGFAPIQHICSVLFFFAMTWFSIDGAVCG